MIIASVSEGIVGGLVVLAAQFVFVFFIRRRYVRQSVFGWIREARNDFGGSHRYWNETAKGIAAMSAPRGSHRVYLWNIEPIIVSQSFHLPRVVREQALLMAAAVLHLNRNADDYQALLWPVITSGKPANKDTVKTLEGICAEAAKISGRARDRAEQLLSHKCFRKWDASDTEPLRV